VVDSPLRGATIDGLGYGRWARTDVTVDVDEMWLAASFENICMSRTIVA
jgi:hypothetical protein